MSFHRLLDRFLQKQQEELSFLSQLEEKEAYGAESFRQILAHLYERRKFRALFQQKGPSFPDEKKEELSEKIHQALLQEEMIKAKLLKLAQKLRQKQRILLSRARGLEKYRSFCP